MAPRGSSTWLDICGATHGIDFPAPQEKQQLFHSSMLPLWLASVRTQAALFVAILCGAPGSGKTAAARRMAEAFGDYVAVVSDDWVHTITDQPREQVEVHSHVDFDSVVKNLVARPKVVLYDARNTQLQDYAQKILDALAAGVKLQNLAWFVFDSGFSEEEEVRILMDRKAKRRHVFLKGSADGCDQDLCADDIRRSVQQMRQQYFDKKMGLRTFTMRTIIAELRQCLHHQKAPLPKLLLSYYGSPGSVLPPTQDSPWPDQLCSPEVPRRGFYAHDPVSIAQVGAGETAMQSSFRPLCAPAGALDEALDGAQHGLPLYFLLSDVGRGAQATAGAFQSRPPVSAELQRPEEAHTSKVSSHIADCLHVRAIRVSHHPCHLAPQHNKGSAARLSSPESTSPPFKHGGLDRALFGIARDQPPWDTGLLPSLKSLPSETTNGDYDSCLSDGANHRNAVRRWCCSAGVSSIGAVQGNRDSVGHSYERPLASKGHRRKTAPLKRIKQWVASNKWNLPNGKCRNPTALKAVRGPTLQSVLNEYWTATKLTLGANEVISDTSPTLFSKSPSIDIDDEAMLQSLQELIDDKEVFGRS